MSFRRRIVHIDALFDEALYMGAGAVPPLVPVVLEVSDYAPLVDDVSRARTKVCVVHDPRPLNNSPRPQHVVFFITRTHHTPPRLSHGLCCLSDKDRSCTRTEIGFIISLRRTPRTKWEHTVGPMGGVISTKRKARHVGAVVS